ncbi:MAG: CDP-glycerol glycerophosphotransferase family protein [Bacilli bacterium]|nr:CDP-glycerol glycerophosphotransferase family protein [Bacilli bacterium]
MIKTLKYIVRSIEIYFRYFLSIIFRIFPINPKKIVVCSYFGNDYGDGAKYIIDELLDDDKYTIVWALKKNLMKNNHLPKNVKPVKYNSLAMLFELSTAKIWIDNARKVIFPLKRKNQFYFQIWHGPISFKTIELDTQETLTKIYIKKLLIDNKNIDYMVSGSKWTNEKCRSAFGYTGKIMECGNPRNDILFQSDSYKEINKKVHSFFNIPDNKKIILYAPTFRNSREIDIYQWDYNLIMNNFCKKFKEDYVFLVRLHPNIVDQAEKMNNYGGNILNATIYPDMQELLIASDILITDYSSSMFDFGMINKKCFLYAPDVDDYLKERHFYFDIRKLPFSLSQNIDDFVKNISSFDSKDYQKKLDTFYKKIGIFETGHSSESIANRIKEICDKNEKK